MREIYAMFRGKYTPEQVMRAAGDGIEAQFYAYLYTGLYHEASGDAERALRQITEAAGDRFSTALGNLVNQSGNCQTTTRSFSSGSTTGQSRGCSPFLPREGEGDPTIADAVLDRLIHNA